MKDPSIELELGQDIACNKNGRPIITDGAKTGMKRLNDSVEY